MGTLVTLVKDERRRFGRRGRVPEESASAAAVRAALGAGEEHLLLHARVYGLDAYRERFGPEVTRALRTLLGHRLTLAVGPAGQALESQPQEVTVLVAAGSCELERWGDAICAAVAPSGIGFTLTASWGAVELGEHAIRPAFALASARRSSALPPWDERPVPGPAPDLRSAAYGLPGPVEDLARAVAERLELGPANAALLAVAATVHDVGKAAIPADVLAKPAALDPVERALVALHPRAGEQLLRADPVLAPAAAIVGALAAPWRDAGIPARILSAAVGYTGMTTARADRPALTTLGAVTALCVEAGERFDPCVVNALVAALADRAIAARPSH